MLYLLEQMDSTFSENTIIGTIKYEVSKISQLTSIILDHELDIDLDEPLYLFTFSPNPELLPNTSFELQHDFILPTISQLLAGCQSGIACVESSQLGNPHYHGWYQLSIDPYIERHREMAVKVLQKLGLLKITKSKGHIKIFSWVQQANCLYYYKKDLLQSQFWTPNNIVTKESQSEVDWYASHNTHYFTIDGRRQTCQDIEERQTLSRFYKQFYEETAFDVNHPDMDF